MDNISAYTLTEKSASEIIGVSARTLRRFRENALAPKHLITPTRRIKYSVKDVNDWIECQLNEGFQPIIRGTGTALHIID